MTDDEEEDFRPPEADAVARRLLILKYLQGHVLAVQPREALETALAQAPDHERTAFLAKVEARHRGLLDGLRRTGLWDDATPDEQRIFSTFPLDVPMQDRIGVSWRAESAGCLAWSLGLLEALPPYDAQVDPRAVLSLVPDGVAEFVQSAHLRDRDEIDAARDLAELWHWRSRTRELQERGFRAKDGQSELADVVREAAAHAARDSLFSPIADDFPALGKAYRDLSSEEWSHARSIAMERHFALNWLSGYAPDNDWAETTTDT